MRKLKYAVEIEIADDIYELLEVASHYGICPITVTEGFRQLIEEALTEHTVAPSEFNTTVTYIEQGEQ